MVSNNDNKSVSYAFETLIESKVFNHKNTNKIRALKKLEVFKII
jgi:hypothetical protein